MRVDDLSSDLSHFLSTPTLKRWMAFRGEREKDSRQVEQDEVERVCVCVCSRLRFTFQEVM